MASQKDRETLKKAYPSKTWAKKVDAMPESQVVATLLSLKRRGKL